MTKINIFAYWKLFLFNTIAIFAMVLLQHSPLMKAHFSFDFRGSNIVSPLTENSHILDKIIPLLQSKKPTSFNVKKNFSVISQVSAAGEYNQANAYGVVNLDTGEVLLEKKLSESISIASITKIMSSVVALDLAAKDERFTVTDHAASIMPTKIGVVPGQNLSVEELINAAILTSANDAVEVLKEGVDAKYGDGAFILAMNEKAKILNMKNSSFENPQGFDGRDHYSSVEDLALLTKYALDNYPLLKEVAKKDYQFYPEDKNHKQFDLYNWNGLLGVYPGAQGFKIGNTGDAGYTTLVVSEREGKRLAVVVLGAPGVKERDLWASQLLDEGFAKYEIKPANVTVEMLKEKYSSWKYWN